MRGRSAALKRLGRAGDGGERRNHKRTDVRNTRKARGWIQQQLADLCNLDRTTIGALERNDYSDIGIRKVERVLTVLGKTLTTQDVGLPTLDDLKAQHG